MMSSRSENNGNDVEYDSAGYKVGSDPLIDHNDQMENEEDADDNNEELEFFILDSVEDDDDDSLEPGSDTVREGNVQEVNDNNKEDVILHSHPDYDEEDVDDNDEELEFFIVDSEEDDDDDSLEPGSNTVQEVNDNNKEDVILHSHPGYDEVMKSIENHMQVLDDEKEEIFQSTFIENHEYDKNLRVGDLLTDGSVVSDSLDNADVIYNSETDNNSSDEEPISSSQSENTEFVADAVAGDDEDDTDSDDIKNTAGNDDGILFSDNDDLMDEITSKAASHFTTRSSNSDEKITANNVLDVLTRSVSDANQGSTVFMVFAATTTLFSVLLVAVLFIQRSKRKYRLREQQAADFDLPTGVVRANLV